MQRIRASQRLRWIGHVINRMSEKRMPEKNLKHYRGKEKKKKTNRRWQSKVKDDLKQMNLTEWKSKASVEK